MLALLVSFLFINIYEGFSQRGHQMWIPRTLGVGRQAADIRKALDAGLTFRPLTETIHDTLVWDRAHPGTVVQNGSISPQREADLLHAWHMRIHE
jgi:2'-hydroxyisoflavone reductase